MRIIIGILDFLNKLLKTMWEGLTICVRRHKITSVWNHYKNLEFQYKNKELTAKQRKLEKIFWNIDRYLYSPQSIFCLSIFWSLVYGIFPGIKYPISYDSIMLFLIYLILNQLNFLRYSLGAIKNAKNKREALEMYCPDLFDKK